MAKKLAKVAIIMIMLFGLVFSVINFVGLNQAYAVDDQPNGTDEVDGNGDACGCNPGGDQCLIVTGKPPVN